MSLDVCVHRVVCDFAQFPDEAPGSSLQGAVSVACLCAQDSSGAPAACSVLPSCQLLPSCPYPDIYSHSFVLLLKYPASTQKFLTPDIAHTDGMRSHTPHSPVP